MCVSSNDLAAPRRLGYTSCSFSLHQLDLVNHFMDIICIINGLRNERWGRKFIGLIRGR